MPAAESLTPPPVSTETRPKANEIDTSNWKTYRNEKYGFGVTFPKELMGNATGDEFLGSYAGNSVNVLIKIVPTQDFSVLHPDFARVMSSRERIVHGIRAKEYFSSENRFVYVPLPVGDKQIEFFAEIGFGNAEENFEKIVSSLNFIK